ncbi:MAG: TatD family hydrolase [Oscillospiraceae bacterium]|jgi:TatD DNase family protein|nr:TatD family hydrolase [Oscillospiraceae bacterium]
MKLIFDTHAHYHEEAFDNDRDVLLNRLPKLGVSAVLNASTDFESAKKTLKLCKEYEFMFAGIGIHPLNVENLDKDFVNKISEMLKEDKVISIGEIGLDYYHKPDTKERQKEVFEEQLKLSLEFDLPVSVHDREAHEDTLALLQKYKPKGMIHCFSGDSEMATNVIDLGMYLSFGGAITFKNANVQKQALMNVPLDKILLETDAPYLTPEPFRSKRCDSSLIPYTAQKISEMRGITPDELLWISKENACDLFDISL